MESDKSRKILDEYSEYETDNDICHDLMQFKVKNILLVASHYDAFILEREGHLNEALFGEYHQLNLSSVPRITNVRSGEEAIEKLRTRPFDMVILTMRNEVSPYKIREQIRAFNERIPILLLINDTAKIPLMDNMKQKHCDINNLDRVFVWNGDAKLFLAMIKYVEDRINADNDTKVGLVPVILLVEDSCRYYSQYLPELYTELMKQSQSLIREDNLNEMNKLLKMRVRPKILLASDYEQAEDLIDRYSENLIGMISDIRFPKNGEINEKAGMMLKDDVREKLPGLPIMLQSSKKDFKEESESDNIVFMHKHSKTLAKEIRDFMHNHLGFGDFVFKDTDYKPIARVSTIAEFCEKLEEIPEESLILHGRNNDFSTWFMARGEVTIAKNMQKVSVEDFNNPSGIRDYLIKSSKNVHYKRSKGKIIRFDEQFIEEEPNVVRLADGSLGGKGRGLAFLNNVLLNSSINDMFENTEISIPFTSIIGTEEFEQFIQRHSILEMDFDNLDYRDIQKIFLQGKLSDKLNSNLRKLLKHIKKPLAIRSSSIFEDSISQSFSGVYNTFLISNNQQTLDKRIEQLSNAIKLVYASVFSPSAMDYFRAINYRIEEEKMAVIIQEVVGKHHADLFYPCFSGVAQSYNFYPISYLKPEDGIAELGLGLGKFVIDGMNSFRFSPNHPKMEIVTPQKMLDHSQKNFYALNLNSNLDLSKSITEDDTLIKNSIARAEEDGVLNMLASVWDYENNRIYPGISKKGPRIVDFAYLLKYGVFPFAKTLATLLDVLKTSMGNAVEMEFAVIIHGREKLYFHPLQLKPLIKHTKSTQISESDISSSSTIIYSSKALGNGTIEDMKDIIFIKRKQFDKFKTREMAKEIKQFNKKMENKSKQYVLIGTGRWGSQDPLLGIPVLWSDISHARVIVESEIEDFRIEPSLGSHFFHNIISMNIGYIHIGLSNGDIIDWDWIESLPVEDETVYFKHVKVPKGLSIILNGMKSQAIISNPAVFPSKTL
ncbi:MAG: PEP/pyruvate-binding domain-containing protein [candidate division WOR-3 bacterium]|nr:PEP/pyruvate-binding domain-containing protein [candidate division WOR-3 bacterium]